MRQVVWTRWDLAAGVVFLAIWRLGFFVPPEWVAGMPFWLMACVLVAGPQLLILALPVLLSFRRRPGGGVHWQGMDRVWRELPAAIVVTIGVLVLLGVAVMVGKHFWPDVSFTPETIDRLSSAPLGPGVFIILFGAVGLAPICEEVFFRGFLHNALRRRMPLPAAAIIQALLFGIAHGYNVLHTAILFVIGLALTGVYEWRKTLLAPMLVHGGYNALCVVGIIVSMVAAANAPMLGVDGEDHADGCLVTYAVPDGAAALARIAPGDIITDIDGEGVHGMESLREVLRSHEIGQHVTIGLIRDGSRITVTALLQKRPDLPR